MVLKELKMAETTAATVISSSLHDYHEPPAVTGRIVSSQTKQKVNAVLTHNANDNHSGSDSEVEDLTPPQSVTFREINNSCTKFEDHTGSPSGINPSTDASQVVHGSNIMSQNIPSAAQALLDEIDKPTEPKEIGPKSTGKRTGTLSKMFRSIRKEKDPGNTSTEDGHFEPTTGGSTMSLGKIIQKVNPVGKNNREAMSKVLQRIGDAFQRVNSNEDSSENKSGEDGSKSSKPLGRLIQFQSLQKSKSSSNTEQKQRSKPGSKLSSNYKHQESS